MQPKTRTAKEIQWIKLAIGQLQAAADHLSEARAPQAAKYVRAARKSAEGALRHALNHLGPYEWDKAVKEGTL